MKKPVKNQPLSVKPGDKKRQPAAEGAGQVFPKSVAPGSDGSPKDQKVSGQVDDCADAAEIDGGDQ